ncbi:MAG TPA: MFS transporter [Bryobacteraceae bacterium]|nr:MFS transporter [Bryobacteraceae bacterium]
MLRTQNVPAAARRQTHPTHVRHIVLGLTVAAYMITYMDRVVISNAAPVIQRELGFSLVTMGWILSAFRWGYAWFQVPVGWLGDRIGPRKALTLIVSWWSVFTSATGLAWNAASMLVVRFLFGIGESGAFPIATRSLSRWMLPSERGFAQGITHAGSRLGAALTPALVVYLVAAHGWRLTFVFFGALGLAWAAVWFWYYRDTPALHGSVNEAERDLIHTAIGGARPATSRHVPWRAILSSSTLWVVSMMYFCYGYCLSIYLDWFPTYLRQQRHFALKEMGLFMSLTLAGGILGDAAGGMTSDYLARRSGNLKMARRVVAMTGFLLAGAAIVPATLTASPMMCVWLSCFAMFALELTVGVSWAIPLDIGADFAGSVSAVMNTWGNIGGAISPTVLAYLVRGYGWDVPFVVAASLCVVAALLFLKIDATRRIQAGAAPVQ